MRGARQGRRRGRDRLRTTLRQQLGLQPDRDEERVDDEGRERDKVIKVGSRKGKEE